MIKRIPWSKDGTLGYMARLNYSGARILFSQDQMNMLDDVNYLSAGINMELAASSADYNLLVFNFASPVSINKVGYFITRWDIQKYFQLQYSLNTTDGYTDGTWTDVGSNQTLVYFNYGEFTVTPPEPAQWWRLKLTGGSWPFNDFDLQNLLLFGEYETPKFEFWDSSGSAELSDYSNLDLNPAYSDTDFSESSAFKIKNLDSSAHTYTVQVIALNYGGDSFVTSYVTASNDGGSNKYSSLETASVAADGLSETINIYCDLLAVNNPKNGIHYWRVIVTEN